MLTLKADALLKHNIDALLRARKQGRVDLSRWCRRSRSWLDKIYSEHRREIPLKYLDRISDFFGIEPYQLFQPGITPLLERRALNDRRSGADRRLRRPQPGEIRPEAVPALRPEDVSDLLLLKSLSASARSDLRQTMDDQRRGRRAKRGRKPPPSGGSGPAAPGSGEQTPPASE